MARQSYVGMAFQKGLFENAKFNKGMVQSNEVLKEGFVKTLANYDISSTGNTLRPRQPFYNVLFKLADGAPISLTKNTVEFRSLQQQEKIFYISIGGSRYFNKTVATVTPPYPTFYPGLTVIDGDTIELNDVRYRLLAIDAPELTGELGEDDAATKASTALYNWLMTQAMYVRTLHLIYDKNSDDDIDTYGRHLVWAVTYADGVPQTANEAMLRSGYAKIFGNYESAATEINMVDYDFVSTSTLVEAQAYAKAQTPALPVWDPLEDENYDVDKTVNIHDAKQNISILSRAYDTTLSAYQTTTDISGVEELTLKLPVMDVLDEHARLDISQVRNDLDIGYGKPIGIQLNTFVSQANHTTHKFVTEHRPLVNFPAGDALFFIGTVTSVDDNGDDEEVYTGLLSVRYNIPVEGSEVLYDDAKFVVESYRENVFEIDYEDLGYTYSPNLLARSFVEPTSLFGAAAESAGYVYPQIRTIIIKNITGDIISTPKRGSYYTLNPIVNLPEADSSYDGYAIKWDIYNANASSSSELPPAIATTGWVMAYTKEGVALDTFTQTVPGIINDASAGVFNGCSFGYHILPLSSTLHTTLATNDQWWGETDVVDMCPVPEIFPLFSSGNKMLYARYHIAPANFAKTTVYYKDGGTPYYSLAANITTTEAVLDASAEWSVTPALAFSGTETTIDHTALTNVLLGCRDIAVLNDQLILYGTPKSENILYLSGTENTPLVNAKYFPQKYALDQFDEPIVHVHPYYDALIVFTNSDIWVAYTEEVTEMNQYDEPVTTTNWIAKKLINNISIRAYAKETVRTVNKNVVFVSNGKLYALKPNSYTGAITDMYLIELSQNIEELLKNPTPFITKRLQYYGIAGSIFNEGWVPEIEDFLDIRQNEVWLYRSVYMPQLAPAFDPTYMYILIYNTDSATWRLYDTRSCGFPIQADTFAAVEGQHTLMRNHQTLDGGLTLMINEALNLWDFDEGFGKMFDIKAIKIVNDTFVFNTTYLTAPEATRDTIKMPIRPYIDTGYMAITPHLYKRFLKAEIEITNIDCVSIPVTLDFFADGVMRQTSKEARVESIPNPNDPTSTTMVVVYNAVPQYLFEPFSANAEEIVDASGITMADWQLGVSKFGPINRLKVEFGISGRGRIPSIEIGFCIRGTFELHKYAVYFKEQTAR